MMHKMDKTPRILTIIGLVFEGLGVLGITASALLFRSIESLPFYDEMISTMSQSEITEMLKIMNILGNIFFVLSIITIIFFILNLYLFVKLLKGKYNEKDAKKVYLYQAVWGGVNMLYNQLTGILYLVSGVMGHNGHKEETNIREGI